MTLRCVGLALLLAAGCEETAGTLPPGGDADAALPWDQGGADIPEYSLGRLLVSHTDVAHLTVFDLDSESVAGTIPIGAGASVFAGGTGRYGYAHDPGTGLLLVIDPGQWLLSHIDHFHVADSVLGARPEHVEAERLSSFEASEGWIALFDAAGGAASVFQERAITAMSFTPSTWVGEPQPGLALVSHGHLFVTEPEEGAWGIAIRSVLDLSSKLRHVPGCSAATDIAAGDDLVVVACAEGLVAMQWRGSGPGELDVWHTPAPEPELRPSRVRMVPRGGVLFDRGPGQLALLDGEDVREFSLNARIVDVQVRRQGTAALVLTADGSLREILLPALTSGRALPLLEPLVEGGPAPRFILSHAYAYVVDPRSPEIWAVRLRSMELEGMFELDDAPAEIAMGGMPESYRDERE